MVSSQGVRLHKLVPSLRTSFISSWLVHLHLFLFLCLLISPTQAATSSSSPSSTPHLCKCTCFSTNSTIIPLLKPLDPSNPCATCTRQFCLDQHLYGCEGARIEKPNSDTGTGWEGEVWARCFQRESGKDETIVSLYLMTIIGLLLAAALRNHLNVWWEEFKTGGTPALFAAMRASLPGRDRMRGMGRGWTNR